jgi:hypothetical protein
VRQLQERIGELEEERREKVREFAECLSALEQERDYSDQCEKRERQLERENSALRRALVNAGVSPAEILDALPAAEQDEEYEEEDEEDDEDEDDEDPADRWRDDDVPSGPGPLARPGSAGPTPRSPLLGDDDDPPGALDDSSSPRPPEGVVPPDGVAAEARPPRPGFWALAPTAWVVTDDGRQPGDRPPVAARSIDPPRLGRA